MHKMVGDIVEAVRKSALDLKIGGPFGAVVYKDGEIVGRGTNCVIGSNDPTAHAEIVAIRQACTQLKTYDLSGCELYATGYPCPMCMSAIIWANIKKVYYSCTYQDVEKIGFRDRHIFDFLKGGCEDKNLISFVQIDKTEIEALYQEFHRQNGQMY